MLMEPDLPWGAEAAILPTLGPDSLPSCCLAACLHNPDWEMLGFALDQRSAEMRVLRRRFLLVHLIVC